MKLQSKLPEGDANGLVSVTSAMTQDPHRVHAVLALVDCSRISTNVDDGSVEPTARIRRIEVLLDDDKATAEQLLRRALDKRMGGAVLPLEVEDEISELFAGMVDTETGEIKDDSGD